MVTGKRINWMKPEQHLAITKFVRPDDAAHESDSAWAVLVLAAWRG